MDDRLKRAIERAGYTARVTQIDEGEVFESCCDEYGVVSFLDEAGAIDPAFEAGLAVGRALAEIEAEEAGVMRYFDYTAIIPEGSTVTSMELTPVFCDENGNKVDVEWHKTKKERRATVTRIDPDGRVWVDAEPMQVVIAPIQPYEPQKEEP